MTDKMKSFVKGILLGMVGKPLPISQGKEPIAYLYNGVRLPKLPEWDRGVYPYAVIDVVNSTTCLNLYALLPTVNGNQYVFADKCAVIYYTLKGDTWEYFDSLTISQASFDDMIWASHDIINADGTTYLAASEPTPVYE